MPNPDTGLSQVNRFQGEKRLDKSFAAGPLKESNGSECRDRLKKKCGAPDPRKLSDCLTVIIERNFTDGKISRSIWSRTGDMKKTISLSTSRMVTGADMDAKSDCSCLAWKTSTPERSGMVLSRWASIPASPRSRWIMWRSKK